MPHPARHLLAQRVNTLMNQLKTASSFMLFVMMAGLILLLGTNILLRYCFDSPIAWSNTISRYAYIFIVLVGSGVAYIEEGHARIDLLYDRVGPGLKRIFDLLHCLIMMAVCLGFIIMGFKHALSMWSVHAPIIPWFPVGAVYLSIPLFAVLIFLYLLKKLLSL